MHGKKNTERVNSQKRRGCLTEERRILWVFNISRHYETIFFLFCLQDYSYQIVEIKLAATYYFSKK